MFNVPIGTWTLSISKTGYISTTITNVTVNASETKDVGKIILHRVPVKPDDDEKNDTFAKLPWGYIITGIVVAVVFLILFWKIIPAQIRKYKKKEEEKPFAPTAKFTYPPESTVIREEIVKPQIPSERVEVETPSEVVYEPSVEKIDKEEGKRCPNPECGRMNDPDDSVCFWCDTPLK
jgi:hypothetical protein